MHQASRLIKIVTCLALVVTAMSTAAAADTSGAVLTKVEYQQLREMQERDKAAASGGHASIKGLIGICDRTVDVSPLIKASKARCLAVVSYAVGDANVIKAANPCSKLKTADAALNCLTPSFVALASDAEALVTSARQVNRIATARRFKSSCVAALGGPKKGLTLLSKFTGDLRLLVTSMEAHNLGLFDVVIKHVNSLEGAVKSNPAPASISICPHQ
jgi:hypothetical protein